MFDKLEHGAELAGMEFSSQFRRVFWVRLKLKDSDTTVLVSNAHYPYQGHPKEIETGQSPRVAQAHATLAILDKLARPDEPVLFMGDLNDPVAVARIFTAAGYQNDCQALGKLPCPTWPASPTAHDQQGRAMLTSQVLDWQWHRGPLRVMNSSVTDFFYQDLAPSDHKPLTVTYALE